MLAWQLLTRAEDYAFQRPSLVRRKLQALELQAGAPRAKPGPNANPVWNTAGEDAEKRLALAGRDRVSQSREAIARRRRRDSSRQAIELAP